MQIRTLVFSTGAAILFATISASAAPLSTAKPAMDSALIEIQYNRHAGPPPGRGPHFGPDRRHPGPGYAPYRPAPRYVPGRRYSAPPHGWRRYGARPGDWRTRGCVMVGPLWFCP